MISGLRTKGARSLDCRVAEDSSEEGRDQVAALEPGAAGVFAEVQQAEHCAEGAAGGDHDVYCGAIFLQTITRPGTLTVQVAHSQESAEAIFNIVQRFWEKLPKADAQGRAGKVALECPPDRVSAARQRVSGGNGGRQRGARDDHSQSALFGGLPLAPRAAETLASLRAAVVPDGEIVLESTPNGAAGVFYEEWQKASETGYTQHFFPWWYERELSRDRGRRGRYCAADATEEKDLMERHGLSEEQIAWRRKQWKVLRGLAAQEYAEDAGSCFLASGNACLIWKRLRKPSAMAGQATEIAG